ncbi:MULTISPECIES: GNAT family N-acetyltransferase [Streptomyces]|uniref:N-acetyltransferase domain-containing protein n=1 Tax=Streptomyces canarius TaxID=285453 RepID=A0ABQ3CNW4_9ACTN|nr:GNAT family N-acetyltransferase [Streptomyces canarius]GHA34048.1 hypothetical protein GCM10010345_43250 [Streptomyces canarius]
MRNRAIAVLGGRSGNAGTTSLALAEAVGAEIGRRGYGMVTGGEGGIAEVAQLACVAEGGQTLGLLKWNRLDDATPATTWALPTSMDLARSNILNWAGDGVIAFEGRYGTLGEIALALDTGRPLIVLGRQPFLDERALDVPTCRYFPDPKVEEAAAILDTLEELIEACAPALVRPGAALFDDGTAAQGPVRLRRTVPEDLALFRQAFGDPEVRRWWDQSARPEDLARFQHERCLQIIDDERTVGFIEYEVDDDSDTVRPKIVIATPEDRDRGLGTTALTVFASAVFAAGHARVALLSDADNDRALRCYEKVGFRTVGRLRSYLPGPAGRHDALLLDLLPDDLASAEEKKNEH